MDALQKRPKISEIEEESLISFVLTDQKVLECRICCELLSPPLYQCKNGHTVCSSCCTKLGKKCPTCPCRIGSMRNRELESVLESLKLSCPYKKFGCKEILDYDKWEKHQETCIYVACGCPHPECSFVSSSRELSLHFSGDHKDSAKIFSYDYQFIVIFNADIQSVVLQEKNDRDLFLLNNFSCGSWNAGNLVSVSRIAPKSCKLLCEYTLYCHSDKTVGNSVDLRSVTENCEGRYLIPRCPSKNSLLVPAGFLGPSRLIKLIVRIGKKKLSSDSTSL